MTSYTAYWSYFEMRLPWKSLCFGLSPPSVMIQVLKQHTSRKLKMRGEAQLWQQRYYDFNVNNEQKRVEKLR